MVKWLWLIGHDSFQCTHCDPLSPSEWTLQSSFSRKIERYSAKSECQLSKNIYCTIDSYYYQVPKDPPCCQLCCGFGDIDRSWWGPFLALGFWNPISEQSQGSINRDDACGRALDNAKTVIRLSDDEQSVEFTRRPNCCSATFCVLCPCASIFIWPCLFKCETFEVSRRDVFVSFGNARANVQRSDAWDNIDVNGTNNIKDGGAAARI